MNSTAIRLRKKELLKEAIDRNYESEAAIAEAIGISKTQLWRAKQPPDSPQYAAPSTKFIAGVLRTFGGPFEKFFFLEEGEARTKQTENEAG